MYQRLRKSKNMENNHRQAIKPGQVYFDVTAIPGWRYLKVHKVRGEFIEVSFLEPIGYWKPGTTGLIKRSELMTKYRLTKERLPIRTPK